MICVLVPKRGAAKTYFLTLTGGCGTIGERRLADTEEEVWRDSGLTMPDQKTIDELIEAVGRAAYLSLLNTSAATVAGMCTTRAGA